MNHDFGDPRAICARIITGWKQVVVVQSGNDYSNQMLILNAATGSTLKTFSNPENFLYSMPRWSLDGKTIVALKIGSKGKTITRFDLAADKSTDLLPMGQENIGHPVLTNSYVLFNSPASGIDNIYALDLKNGKRFQITSSKYGAYNPAVSRDERWLYYNDQSRDGLDVARIPFNPAEWTNYVEAPSSVTENLADALVKQEGTGTFWDSIPQKTFLKHTQNSRHH